MWVACSRSRWALGFPGKEDTEPNQASRWPKSSLCLQAPSAPALAVALHGEGTRMGRASWDPEGLAASSVLSITHVSGREGEDSAAFNLKESASYEWWVGLRREKYTFP